MVNTLVNRIIDLADDGEFTSKLAVAFKNDALTYEMLAKNAAGMSKVLKENGVLAGDRVSYSATSKVETIVIYLAIHMVGAVSVFLDKNAAPQSMADIYVASGSKILLTDKPLKEHTEKCNVLSIKTAYEIACSYANEIDDLDAYRITPNDDDLADILFTSGTTGKPKGVMLSFKSVINILQNTIDGIGIRADDVLLMPLPLNHSFALRVTRAVLYKGATLILQNGFTFAKAVEDNVKRFNCNSMACVPASYEVMRGQMQDKFPQILGDMRFIEFGAGSLSVQQRKTITRLIPNVTIFNTWGSSESGGAIFCNVSDVVKNEKYIGALGIPLEDKVEVKIIDTDGNAIESSAANPGRMAIKGDMKMVGYWDNAEETSKTLVGDWLLTGDMAYLLDGYVFMLGRADNIINVGGEKVSPIEVENMAGQFPGISECACIGVEDPDGVLGQVPALFVVGESSVKADDIKKFLAERTERYKIPTIYKFIDKLPRNRMKKVDYREIKRLYESAGTEELMNDTVRTILARRSVRKFTDREVPTEILEMILKCGYYAPSGHNMQSWRFTVLTMEEDIQRLKAAAKEAAQTNGVHFYGFEKPKVLILVSNDKRNVDGCQDASVAAENIMLAATSYGLGSVWLNPLMTLRDASPVKEVLDEFGVPENHVVWSTVALGYPEAPGVLLQKNSGVVRFV